MRCGKPLQYPSAVESFCSCHTVMFGTASVIFILVFILVTVLCFQSLMEGIAAMWMDDVRKSLARKLLPRLCLSSARSQVREPSALRVHSFKAT